MTAVGTMGYAPPELFSGQVEPRSDIYSLGSTMFHLLTGADPQNNPLLIFDFQKNPRPRQINPRLSDQMERILMRCGRVQRRRPVRVSRRDAAGTAGPSRESADRQCNVRHYRDHRRPSAWRTRTSFADSAASVSSRPTCFVRFAVPNSRSPSRASIPRYTPAETSRPGSLSTARATLQAPAYSLEKNENLVGRRDPMSNIFPEVDLSKYDPQTKISRRHARIWREGKRVSGRRSRLVERHAAAEPRQRYAAARTA